MRQAAGLVLTLAVVAVPGGSAAAQPASSSSGLVGALDSSDVAVRANAAWKLAEAGPVVPATLERLGRMRDEDLDEGARLAATYACGRLATKELRCPGPEYDQPAKLKKQPRPKYPEKAFARRVQGSVNVYFLISERGSVALAEIPREPITNLDRSAAEAVKALDAAALEAVRKWTFEPAKRRGKAVACWAVAPVSFRVE